MNDGAVSTPDCAADGAERLARVTLSLVAEPGDPVFAGLTHELGGKVFLEALLEDTERHEELAAASTRLADVDPARTLDQAARLGVRFVIPGDAEWPGPLDDLAGAGAVQERGGPPIGLWVRGPARLDRLTRAVAIVGSRSATTYGDQVAGDIAAHVGHEGIPIISGAAFGIDRAAHRGSVSAGALSAAVLACGADRIYPAAHRDLLDYLAREHLVISETAPGGAPHRVRFLARNRIIAALSRSTVVVEAAARSGALNTVNWAQRLHRPVLGVPGPVTSATSVGVHQQIRCGAATLVTGGADVLEMIGSAGEHLVEVPRGPEHPRDTLPVRQRQVLDAVPVHGAAGTASVASVAGMAVVQVGRILHALEVRGLVDRSATGWSLTTTALH